MDINNNNNNKRTRQRGSNPEKCCEILLERPSDFIVYGTNFSVGFTSAAP